MTKLIVEFLQLKSKITARDTIEESDIDVQFISQILKKYSDKKKEFYGEKLEYSLDVAINDPEEQYKTLDDCTGTKLSSFFAGLGNNQNMQKEDTVSSSNEKFSDTDSDYDYGENDMTESVNKKMAVSLIELNRSVASKGIEIVNTITEHIILIDDDETVVSEYLSKPKIMQNDANSSLENISEEINDEETTLSAFDCKSDGESDGAFTTNTNYDTIFSLESYQ